MNILLYPTKLARECGFSAGITEPLGADDRCCQTIAHAAPNRFPNIASASFNANRTWRPGAGSGRHPFVGRTIAVNPCRELPGRFLGTYRSDPCAVAGRAATIAEGTHVFARQSGTSFRDEDRRIGPVLPGMMLDVIKIHGKLALGWPWLGYRRGCRTDGRRPGVLLSADQERPTYFALVSRARVLL